VVPAIVVYMVDYQPPPDSLSEHQRRLLFCPNKDCRQRSLHTKPNPRYLWCLDVYCLYNHGCHQEPPWHICLVCDTDEARKALQRRRLSRHHKHFHFSSLPLVSNVAPFARATAHLTPDFQIGEAGGQEPVPAPDSTTGAPSLEYASDAFLASLYRTESATTSIEFSELFEQKLAIPAYMGGMNRKAAALQAERNVTYFESEHERPGFGPASLVARAKFMSASKTGDVDSTEALFVLLNTWLVNQLGDKQLTVFTALMKYATEQASLPRENNRTDDHQPLASPPKSLFLPLVVNTARTDLLNGVRSIMANTARPYTHTLRNGYSYVSCIDSLACLLASGVKFEPLVGRLSPFLIGKEGQFVLRFNSDTPRGAEIQANAETCFGPEAFDGRQRIETIILPAFLWSDSCDPNTTKQNRGSVHAFLLSVAFNQDDAHSGTTTLLLALGPAESPTDDVEVLFQQELERLVKPTGNDNLFYVADSKTVCRVFVQVYSLQEDRVERQSVTRNLAGNSNYTARWGWLADLFAQQNFLPSCAICYQGLLANEDLHFYRSRCGCCANWEMTGLTSPPPPGYPVDRLEPDSQVLNFRQITFEGMHSACTEAYIKVSTAIWRVFTAEVFLKTEGINTQFASLVLTAASNRLKLTNMDHNSDKYRSHLFRSRCFNSTFPVEQPDKPATWCYPGVSILDHIDVIMHLLFLGIAATVLKEAFFTWLKAHRLMTDLSQITKQPLKELDLMSLAWCKALPINETGTLGSAVSENYLSYCRLGKYLFGCSSILKAEDVVYRDPVRPLNSYTLIQIKAWYSAREIRIPAVDNEELRARFLADNAVEGGPPNVPEKGEAGIPKKVADDMINSMVALVAHVMVEGGIGDEQVWAVERHAKLFLSSYDKFDSFRRRNIASRPQIGRRKKKNLASWISHMNFVSLLNLPGVMRRYGSLRILWEGDRKGEGGLPPVKAKVNQGLVGTWSTGAARAVLGDTALERALESAANACGSDHPERSEQQLLEAAKLVVGKAGSRVYKDYKTYDDEPQALQALASGSPVSLAMLVSDSNWCLALKGSKVLPITILLDEEVDVIGGAAYHTFVTGQIFDLNLEDGEKERDKYSKYGLLLPQLTTRPVFPGRHYLITSNWEELNREGNIVRYRMDGANYD
jgi:hypothetical protein